MSGHDSTGTGDAVAVGVVDALADAMETDPLTMDPPLYEAVDPDALERLVGGDGRARVSFEYGGHTVVVSGDGTVTVDDEVTRAWATATAPTDESVGGRVDRESTLRSAATER